MMKFMTMKYVLPTLLLLSTLSPAKSLKLSSLPPAVRQAVTENAKGAEIKAITSEKEKGVTEYEVETMLNGKHRDFNLDSQGKLVSVEEEVVLDSIPAAARTAIEKKVASGKLERVELITARSKTTWEASFTTAKGKKQEFQVTADGSAVKD